MPNLLQKPIHLLTPSERAWRTEQRKYEQGPLTYTKELFQKDEELPPVLRPYFLHANDIPNKPGNSMVAVRDLEYKLNQKPSPSVLEVNGLGKYAGWTLRQIQNNEPPERTWPMLRSFLKEKGINEESFLSNPVNAIAFLLPADSRYRARLLDSVDNSIKTAEANKSSYLVSRRARNATVIEGREPVDTKDLAGSFLSDPSAGLSEAYPSLTGALSQATETFSRPDETFNQEERTPPTPLDSESARVASAISGIIPHLLIPSTQPGSTVDNLLTASTLPFKTVGKLMASPSKTVGVLDALKGAPLSIAPAAKAGAQELNAIDQLMKLAQPGGKVKSAAEVAKFLESTLSDISKVPDVLKPYARQVNGKITFDIPESVIEAGLDISPQQAKVFNSLNQEAKLAPAAASQENKAASVLDQTPETLPIGNTPIGRPVQGPDVIELPLQSVARKMASRSQETMTPAEIEFFNKNTDLVNREVAKIETAKQGAIWSDSPRARPSLTPLPDDSSIAAREAELRAQGALEPSREMAPELPGVATARKVVNKGKAALGRELPTSLQPEGAVYAEPAPSLGAAKSAGTVDEVKAAQEAAATNVMGETEAEKAARKAKLAEEEFNSTSNIIPEKKKTFLGPVGKTAAGIGTAAGLNYLLNRPSGNVPSPSAVANPTSRLNEPAQRDILQSARDFYGTPPASSPSPVTSQPTQFPSDATRVTGEGMSGNQLMQNISANAPSSYTPGGEQGTPYQDMLANLAHAVSVGAETYQTGTDANRSWQALQLQRQAESKRLSDAEREAINHMYGMDFNVQKEGSERRLNAQQIQGRKELQQVDQAKLYDQYLKATAIQRLRPGAVEGRDYQSYPQWVAQNGFGL